MLVVNALVMASLSPPKEIFCKRSQSYGSNSCLARATFFIRQLFLQPVIVNRDFSFISVIHLMYFSYILVRCLEEESWDTDSRI